MGSLTFGIVLAGVALLIGTVVTAVIVGAIIHAKKSGDL